MRAMATGGGGAQFSSAAGPLAAPLRVRVMRDAQAISVSQDFSYRTK